MDQILFDFMCPKALGNWQIIDDKVMGGQSKSNLIWNPSKTVTFSGELNLEDHGGFASIRCLLNNFDAQVGLTIRVKGEAKYQLKLRTDPFMDGINYVQPFQATSNQWLEVQLLFPDFKPSFRGLILPDAPPLDPQKIQQLGILISDQQAGPFSLEIDWIKAC